jgi:hypothetical protein
MVTRRNLRRSGFSAAFISATGLLTCSRFFAHCPLLTASGWRDPAKLNHRILIADLGIQHLSFGLGIVLIGNRIARFSMNAFSACSTSC